MGNAFYFNWEVDYIIFLQKFMNNLMTSIMTFISEFGDQIIIIAILGFFYWCYDKKIGRRIAIGMSFANICYPLLKNIFLRQRPYVASSEIKCLKAVDEGHDIYDLNHQGFSFPSGHATNSMFLYGSIFKNYKNIILRIFLGLIILLVGLSRNALGVHYPTDILVGWLIGLAVICLFDLFEKKSSKKYYYPILLIIGAIGFFYCSSTDYYTGYGMFLGVVCADFVEEKYVNFRETKNILECIVRVLLGGIIYFGLNVLLKAPFSSEFLEMNSFLPHLIRSLRYAIIMFIEFAIYPMCFKYIKFKK